MLDVSIRTELLRLMLDLRAERGLTYLFITHDLSLAWVIADRIAVMYLGKIMEIGPAKKVIKAPRRSRRRPARARNAPCLSAKRQMLPTSRPAAGSIPAARSCSIAAGWRSRRSSTSATASQRPVGSRKRGPRRRSPAEPSRVRA